jgi:hypothetical protein
MSTDAVIAANFALILELCILEWIRNCSIYLIRLRDRVYLLGYWYVTSFPTPRGDMIKLCTFTGLRLGNADNRKG